MLVFAIDLSTKPGVAILKDEQLLFHTTLFSKTKRADYGEYPVNIFKFTDVVIENLIKNLMDGMAVFGNPDLIVIEETSPGRETYSQKQLEFLHYALCKLLLSKNFLVKYVRTGEWRKVVNLRMSKDDKSNNKLVSQGKKRGRITKKHLSVRIANELFSLQLKLKDEDAADAILLGLSVFKNVIYSTGTSKKV